MLPAAPDTVAWIQVSSINIGALYLAAQHLISFSFTAFSFFVERTQTVQNFHVLLKN